VVLFRDTLDIVDEVRSVVVLLWNLALEVVDKDLVVVRL
jgi:hypothetical protein